MSAGCRLYYAGRIARSLWVLESGANCCEDVSELFVLPDGEIPVCISSVGAAWGDLVIEGSSARVCWSG